jgi:site-specific recombinase XerD
MSEPQDLVQEYLSYLLAVRGISERTLHAYGNDLARYANYCANRGVSAATAASWEVQGFIADLSAEGTAPASINRALSSIRGLYRWMARFDRRKDRKSVV